MKKIFVASVFLGLASMAQAATIVSACIPAPATYIGVSGGGTENCTIGTAPGGSTINSVTYAATFDGVYDGFLTGGSITYTLTGPGGQVLGSSVVQGGPQSNVSAACNAACLADIADGAFTVIDAFTGNGAAVTGATFNKRVTIDYTPQGTVPEPSTYAMMAVGLVGFYMVRRKA